MSNLLKRYRGDTYSIEAVLSKNGIPLDLTDGSTVKLSYIKGKTSNTISGVNGTIAGEISFPFPATVVSGIYSYDIQVIDSTGEIRTYVKDTLQIEDDITK